jgi:hypothetical protein
MKRAFLLVALVGWGGLGCGGALGPLAEECGAIKGKVYESVDNHETGLGPQGVAMGKWSVVFKGDGSYEWNHSDVQESGRYFCDGLSVEGTIGDGDFYEGTFNRAGDALTWEGVDYAFATDSDR